MTNYQRVLRANVLAELGRADVTRARAGEWIGLSPASFGQRLSGKTDFRMGELMKIAGELKVPVSTLTNGLDDSDLDDNQGASK